MQLGSLPLREQRNRKIHHIRSIMRSTKWLVRWNEGIHAMSNTNLNHFNRYCFPPLKEN